MVWPQHEHFQLYSRLFTRRQISAPLNTGAHVGLHLTRASRIQPFMTLSISTQCSFLATGSTCTDYARATAILVVA